jgi:16S rRNA processing protein RimM
MVAVAEVARPHGVTGEVRLRVYNLESDLLLGRPPIVLRLADGSRRPDRLSAVRRVEGAMLARLESARDRDAVEALRGAIVEVPRSALGEPGDGEVYHCDLEGCEVRLGEALVGRVTRVASYPTCDALIVARDEGPSLEVPLTDAFVVRVDVGAGVIELSSLPE